MSDPSFQMQVGACHVIGFFFDLDGVEDMSLSSARTVLTPEELARGDRFKFQIHRDRFVRGRGFLRRALGSLLGADPAGLNILTGPQGKPFLKDDPVWFNLSHSEGDAVLAVSKEGPIGVDLERHDRKTDFVSLATQVFTRSECDRLEAQPDEPARRRFFFLLWTGKEARMKMTGEGMSLAPKSIFLGFDDTGVPEFCAEPATPRTALVYVSGVEEASCAVAAPRHL